MVKCNTGPALQPVNLDRGARLCITTVKNCHAGLLIVSCVYRGVEVRQLLSCAGHACQKKLEKIDVISTCKVVLNFKKL
jgi:hypothetical protein